MRADEPALVLWAQRAGQGALPIFVGLLVLLLLGVALLIRAGRHPRLRAAADARGLGVPLAAGFAVTVAAGWVFAELAERLGAAGPMGRADQALADALGSSVPHAALQVFALLTRLGDTATLSVLCIAVAFALAAVRQNVLALGWVAAVGGNALLNVTLKSVFARVRPVHDGGLVTADGYSFPSGHSSGSLVAYGMLAYVALRLLPPRWHVPAVLLASALAFTVGSSRVFLRVHFASDVLAGMASGAAWLAVCIVGIELSRRVRSAW